jgi:hypothetical protein
MLDFEIPVKEIERRKHVVRDVWQYKKDLGVIKN